MTAAVWMAIPPEALSTWLYTGPGAGPWVTAAMTWYSLSAIYAAAAAELSAMLIAVQAGIWQGPGVEAFVLANGLYAAWLTQASADSAAAATQQEVVADAYTAALAAMPTPPELAANRLIFGVLVVTNFFGLNTIPIAKIEADYLRMWIQAATVMAFYQSVTSVAVASTPEIAAAPQIVKSPALTEGQALTEGRASTEDVVTAADPPTSPGREETIAEFLRAVTGGRAIWDAEKGTVNGVEYDSYADPGDPLWWLARVLEVGQDFEKLGDLLSSDPLAAVLFLAYIVLLDWPHHILQLVSWLAQNPLVLGVALSQAAAGLGAVTGLVGLAGLGAHAAVLPDTAPALEPATLPAMVPASGLPPSTAAPATAPASGSAPATAAGTTAPAPAPASPAAGAGGFPPYLIGGGPGIGFGSGMSARAKARAPASDVAAAAAAAQASAREEARARRRRRAAAKERGHRDEFVYLGMDSDPATPVLDDPPGVETSDRGVGRLGFVGTVRNEAVAAAVGLATLVGDELEGSPRMPMMPATWGSDPDLVGEGDGRAS